MSLAPPVRHGWLQKHGRSGIIKNWKRRYVVLLEGKLTYYTDAMDKHPFGENEKGSLELVNTEIIDDRTKYDFNQIYIEAYSGEKSILVMTELAEDTVGWRESVILHINYANNRANVASSSKEPKSLELGSIYRESSDEFEATPDVDNRMTFQVSPPNRQRTSTDSSNEVLGDSSSFGDGDKNNSRLLPDYPQAASATLSNDLENMKGFGQYVLSAVNSLRGAQQKQVLQDMTDTLKDAAGALIKNTKDRDVGNQDEKWLVAPILLTCLIVFGRSLYVRGLLRLTLSCIGLPIMLVGLFAMGNSFYELRGNNCVLASPAKDHSITSGGMFAVIRHPFYGGIIMLCMGLSLFHLNAENLMLSIFLSISLDSVATIEEKYLLYRYPTAYRKYCVGKRKLIPFVH
jgi:protein-S-isoprenylcysteine O-methyltransferase Ste14